MDRKALEVTEESEREKYTTMWGLPDDSYRKGSPGQRRAPKLKFKTIPESTIVWGCGPGFEAMELKSRGCKDVQMVDIAENCLDKSIAPHVGEGFEFICSPIIGAPVRPAECGLCIDVMEHMPEKWLMPSLVYMNRMCDYMFYEIAMFDDKQGDKNVGKLHLTIQSWRWWLDLFAEVGIPVAKYAVKNRKVLIDTRGGIL